MHRLTMLIALLLALAGLTACDRGDSLQAITERGELVVVSRNSPTTYYFEQDQPSGFEYTLAAMFASELGVSLKVVPAFTLADIFQRLRRGEADIAAAGLTLTSDREDEFPHTVSYLRQRPQVIYRSGNYRPRQVSDMIGMDVITLAGSSHARALWALRDGGFPGLRWREIQGADSMTLLEALSDGEAELALLDSNEFAVQQRLHPRLKVAFDIGSPQDHVWYLSPGADNTRLLARLDAFLQRIQEDGSMEAIREEHFGSARIITRIGSHTFALNMRRQLPLYRTLIEDVALEYQMDWHLLAAIAYQESHWDPAAVSPTGVRGMMMLTEPTAREMGVTDRTDAAQSLRGGARYYKDQKRRLADDIPEPDRTFMALAAYNIGRAHLEDARILTERRGGDPHLWNDVMENLPLLEKPQYFETLRYGYARGREAVGYVQNIRHYQGILQWRDIRGNAPLPPIPVAEYLPAPLKDLSLRAL